MNNEMIAKKIKAPISIPLLNGLFRFLDQNMKVDGFRVDGCRNNHDHTVRFLQENGVKNIQQVLDWLKQHHGFCDCEIMLNVIHELEQIIKED